MGDPEEHGTADRGVQLYDTEAVRDVLSGLSLEGSTSGDSIQSRGEFMGIISLTYPTLARLRELAEKRV